MFRILPNLEDVLGFMAIELKQFIVLFRFSHEQSKLLA